MSKFKDIANRAAKRNDQTVTKTNVDFAPPPAGATLARFVDYIEVGLHKQKAFKGKEKAPAHKVYVTFELLGAKYIREIDTDAGKKKVADRITVPLTLSLHEKASFKKLFKKMTYGRQEIVHMAQMLGEGFIVTVVHNEKGEGADKKVYANITDDDGNFLVSGPFKVDALEGTSTPLKVPPMLGTDRLFIWDEPTKETWDSIFIDGEREVKDEKGKAKTVSKNWIQGMITSALNFEGSPVQTFLEGSGGLPENPAELEEELEEYEEFEEEVIEVPAKKQAAKKTKVQPDANDDVLTAMGLSA